MLCHRLTPLTNTRCTKAIQEKKEENQKKKNNVIISCLLLDTVAVLVGAPNWVSLVSYFFSHARIFSVCFQRNLWALLFCHTYHWTHTFTLFIFFFYIFLLAVYIGAITVFQINGDKKEYLKWWLLSFMILLFLFFNFILFQIVWFFVFENIEIGVIYGRK